MSEESRDFIWRVHDYTCSFIQFADTKAGVIFAWSSGLLAWLFSSYDLANVFTTAQWLQDWVEAISMLVTAVALVVAAFFSVMVIAPIMAMELPRSPCEKNDSEGLVYWRSVRRYSADEYVIAVNAESPMEKEAAMHTYVLAGVADRKYKKLFYAVWWSVAGTALTLVVIVLH